MHQLCSHSLLDAVRPIYLKSNKNLMFFYLIKSLITSSLDSQVDHGVGEGATHVELQGQVINSLKK